MYAIQNTLNRIAFNLLGLLLVFSSYFIFVALLYNRLFFYSQVPSFPVLPLSLNYFFGGQNRSCGTWFYFSLAKHFNLFHSQRRRRKFCSQWNSMRLLGMLVWYTLPHILRPSELIMISKTCSCPTSAWSGAADHCVERWVLVIQPAWSGWSALVSTDAADVDGINWFWNRLE